MPAVVVAAAAVATATTTIYREVRSFSRAVVQPARIRHHVETRHGCQRC